MGWGDNLLATGMARGAKARGKRIAFGDGTRIIWDQHSGAIFSGNPNIAKPGHEHAEDIEWVPFYKGNRGYNRQDGDRWIWNYEFKAKPGQLFFTTDETRARLKYARGFVLIEPNVPRWKTVAQNKDWGFERYASLAQKIRQRGYRVVQFNHGSPLLPGVLAVRTKTFRDALAIMSKATLFVGPEGGMHHGAAATGVPAVVLFGGFIPPQVTGYDSHINLTGGVEACGSLKPCEHCRAAMDAITVDEVDDACQSIINRGKA